jgi:hypothetical protein
MQKKIHSGFFFEMLFRLVFVCLFFFFRNAIFLPETLISFIEILLRKNEII